MKFQDSSVVSELVVESGEQVIILDFLYVSTLFFKLDLATLHYVSSYYSYISKNFQQNFFIQIQNYPIILSVAS